MKSRAKPLAILCGVFLLGAVAGAAGSHAYTIHELRSRLGGPSASVRVHLKIEALRRQLDLNEEQVTKIEAIFREADGELERFMKPCSADVEALRKRTDERIAELLDPAQRQRFAELAERHRHKRFPPPPPP